MVPDQLFRLLLVEAQLTGPDHRGVSVQLELEDREGEVATGGEEEPHTVGAGAQHGGQQADLARAQQVRVVHHDQVGRVVALGAVPELVQHGGHGVARRRVSQEGVRASALDAGRQQQDLGHVDTVVSALPPHLPDLGRRLLEPGGQQDRLPRARRTDDERQGDSVAASRLR